MIRTYAASGTRLRDRSLESIETLETLGKVAVKRNKRGTITGAQFKSDNGANPLSKTAHMGQVYSYVQELPSGHKCWKHRALCQNMAIEALFGEPVEDRAELDKYVRAVYLNVALSVIVEPQPKQPPAPAPSSAAANVRNIADYADRRPSAPRRKPTDTPARPIEFDSRLRAA